MSLERVPTREDHPEEASQESAAEESFTATIERAVETLFISQSVGERLQGVDTGDESVAAFIEAWQQRLSHHLTEMARLTVETVATSIDLFQSGLHPPGFESLSADEVAVSEWYKPFSVASICRRDLRGLLTNEEITNLSNDDLENIADKMSDAYRDSGLYWESLEVMAREELKRNQESGPGLGRPEIEGP